MLRKAQGTRKKGNLSLRSFWEEEYKKKYKRIRKKQMKKFIQKNSKIAPEQTDVDVTRYIIDPENVNGLRLAVYENHSLGKKTYSAEIDFYHENTPSDFIGLKCYTERKRAVKLRQNFSDYDNVRSRIPQGLVDYKPHYDVMRRAAKRWANHHATNLHCKLGARLDNRYHTMLGNWCVYDAAQREMLLMFHLPVLGQDENSIEDSIVIVEAELNFTGSTSKDVPLYYTYLES